MFGLPLAFTVPVVLAALAALPVLYWLLRMTPPPPAQVVLPTLPLVLDIERKQETPAHTPWWLLLLRLGLAALIILAMAGPLWNPDKEARSGDGPLLMVIDNSWTAAPDWKDRVERAAALIETAGAAGRPVALRAISDLASEIVPAVASRALEQVRSLMPVPHTLDRKMHEASIATFLERNAKASVLWIADRVALSGDGDVLVGLARIAGDRLTVLASDEPTTIGLAGTANTPDALTVKLVRVPIQAATPGSLRALDSKGRQIAETRFLFPRNAGDVMARFEVPLEIRNEMARIELIEQHSAGSVVLLDGRNRRRRVGIISGETTDSAQPLVSPAYFIARALNPFADVREAPRGLADPVARLIEDGVGVIVLTDVGALTGQAIPQLTAFVEKGGILLRFASRWTNTQKDPLFPVTLRRNERIMGGSLSWDTPRKLAAFGKGSPFEGMAIPADVTVSQQILAEPEANLTEKTWAALEDGTPLITGDRRGNGYVVLFHVTADTSWSSLPLSVAFVETLRRITNLSSLGDEVALETATDKPRTEGEARREVILNPLRTLDGFGSFQSPPVSVEPVQRSHTAPASAKHPPGFYGVAEAPLAVNALAANAVLLPVTLSGLNVRPLLAEKALDLRGLLIGLAMLLLLMDALAVLWLSGALARLVPARSVAISAKGAASGTIGLAFMLAFGLLMMAALPVLAQQANTLPAFRADDIEAALSTRLAYVVTGDASVDETSRQGLQGLSRNLSSRTALDPGEPIGLDISRDELAYYPLLYWPMVAGRAPPNEAAMRRIERFMKGGGTIIFDTRDALTTMGSNAATSPENQLLRRILAGIDVPDLEAIPKDHVITKTFYILDGFVGRYNSGRTWVEILQRSQDQDKTRPAQAGDRVSPIIITSNDLAAAWAVDRSGQPRFPLIPGTPRQREMAIRGGINIVMYALTGNYKADQVHVPALLERLGQ